MSREMEDRLRAALSAKAEQVDHADLRPAQPPTDRVRSPRRFRLSLPWLAPVMAAAAIVLVVVGVTGGWFNQHSSANKNAAAGASSATSPALSPSAASTQPAPVPTVPAFSGPENQDASSGAGAGISVPTATGRGALKVLSTAVLGSAAYWPAGNTRGFGQTQPGELNTNGDPSGIVTGITWHDWGSQTATGIGQTYLPKPGGGYYPGTVTIELRATNLGACGSVVGYQQLLYRVPTQPGGQPTGAWQLWANATNLCQSR